MLEVSALRVASGAMTRVQSLDLSLAAGGCVALLGPNGAGKTASVEAIAGLVPKAAGRVMFNGEDITDFTASTVVRRGLALVPQWRELFPNFSVEETLLAGSNAARGRPALPCDTVYDLFPRLAERRRQLAGSLSGGEQQMLAIGRALVTNPKVMLLDEPSAGLAVGSCVLSSKRSNASATPVWRSCWSSRTWRSRLHSPSCVSCWQRDAWYGAGPPATPPTAKKSGKLILPD